MTIRNIELLERVMQHIEDHPERHSQDIWVSECGAAACFAGWACLLSDWQVSDIPYGGMAVVMSPDRLAERSVPQAAEDLLGLDSDEAHTLFHSLNTRPMLRLMVKDLVNGDSLRGPGDYRRETGDEVA